MIFHNVISFKKSAVLITIFLCMLISSMKVFTIDNVDVRNITGLVVLVDFSDQEQQVTPQEITDMLNRNDYSNYQNNGSVKDYWLDVSAGKSNYSNIVIGYHRAVNPKSSYENSSGKLDLINEAVAYAKSTGFDFSTLSRNSANEIESFSVLYAGNATYALNPQSSSITSNINGVQTVLKGHIVYIGNEPSIGTFIHESGHTLFGMMDTYEGGYTNIGTINTYGLGNYDLMADAGSDKNPVPPNPYFRYLNGWLNIVTLNNTGNKSLNDITANSNDVFICYKNLLAQNLCQSEYFLIEKINRTGRRAAMPGEGILVWHIDFTRLNMSQDNWVPISIVQADGKNDMENKTNKGEQTDFFTTQTLSDTTTPNVKWWDNSKSGLQLDCSYNNIVCFTKPYDYNIITPYGTAEIKYDTTSSVSAPAGCKEAWWNTARPYLQYGEITARIFDYTDNKCSCALVIYNKNNEIITILEVWGRYPTEMHLDTDNQALVFTHQTGTMSIPLVQIAPYAFPPEIIFESRSSVSDLIPAGMRIDFPNNELIPYLQYGIIKVREFSYLNKTSIAVVFYNTNNEIIKVLDYSGNSDAVEMHLDEVNQTLVISGQATSPTRIPLSLIVSIAFPASSEAESDKAEIKFENRYSILEPPGLKLDYWGYEQIPYLQYGVIKARTFSYRDNRISFAVVIYNSNNEIIKILEYEGNRYAIAMHLDVVNQALVINGQYDLYNSPTMIPLTQIAPLASPPEIIFESRSSISVPSELKESMWQTNKRPYLQYCFIKARIFDYADNRNSCAIVIYNQNNEIITILEVWGRYATEMYLSEDDQVLVFSHQFGTTSLPLSLIAIYNK